MSGNMVDWVILDVMDDVFSPQRKYPESFVSISLLEVCQEGGYLVNAKGS